MNSLHHENILRADPFPFPPSLYLTHGTIHLVRQVQIQGEGSEGGGWLSSIEKQNRATRVQTVQFKLLSITKGAGFMGSETYLTP